MQFVIFHIRQIMAKSLNKLFHFNYGPRNAQKYYDSTFGLISW